MENKVARRRINTIAAHFASADDFIAAATHVFPMSCSSLNSVIRRCDNRMYFARQSSCSQACYMRPSTREQMATSDQSALPPKCNSPANEGSFNACDAPLFSRPSKMEPKFHPVGAIQSMVQECNLAAPDPPMFSRPIRRINELGQLQSGKEMHDIDCSGFQQFPRMDVAESGCSYIIAVELPGVNIGDIRVEVNEQNLTVLGKKLCHWWGVATSESRVSTYHRKEISQGPYQIVWPLPTNVNKDSVSAEFVDGLLRIIVPKL